MAVNFTVKVQNANSPLTYQMKSLQWPQKVGCLKKRITNWWPLTSFTFFWRTAPRRSIRCAAAVFSSSAILFHLHNRKRNRERTRNVAIRVANQVLTLPRQAGLNTERIIENINEATSGHRRCVGRSLFVTRWTTHNVRAHWRVCSRAEVSRNPISFVVSTRSTKFAVNTPILQSRSAPVCLPYLACIRLAYQLFSVLTSSTAFSTCCSFPLRKSHLQITVSAYYLLSLFARLRAVIFPIYWSCSNNNDFSL